MVVTINHGDQGSVTFICRARGTPTPTISWFLNERNVTQLDDSRIEEIVDKKKKMLRAGKGL